MPFTGSHPAAVIPLMRLGLVPSALVIGSMTPDLPYYLPLPVSSALTHSGGGILGLDLALGLISFVVWQLLVGPLVVAAVWLGWATIMLGHGGVRAALFRTATWGGSAGLAVVLACALVYFAATAGPFRSRGLRR